MFDVFGIVVSITIIMMIVMETTWMLLYSSPAGPVFFSRIRKQPASPCRTNRSYSDWSIAFGRGGM